MTYEEIRAVVNAVKSRIGILEHYVKSNERPETVGQERKLEEAKKELNNLKQALRKL